MGPDAGGVQMLGQAESAPFHQGATRLWLLSRSV